MDKAFEDYLYATDFNMVECGAIVINRKKLEDYKRDTRIIKFKRGV